MIDITHKKSSLRRASAEGYVSCSQETLNKIKNHQLPKGELFETARAAGLLGAKQTPFLIPHCHPISVDHLEIDFSLQEEGMEKLSPISSGILIRVSGQCIGKTGIEMEVLTSLSITALTVYDLLKPVDSEIVIEKIHLVSKTGGKTIYEKGLSQEIRCCVLVCSDSSFQGKRRDESGKYLCKVLESYQAKIQDYQIVPDDISSIREQVKKWTQEEVDFIFSTGGTGASPRDLTREAMIPLIDKELQGIGESIRFHGLMRTPFAAFSCSFAGISKKTIIVSLPGSRRAVKESLEPILPEIFHLCEVLSKDTH